MLKITYYIFRQLSLTTLFVTIILTSAVWLTQSLKYVDSVINKGLPLSTFFYLIILLLPDLISIVLPAALLAAMLYTYNKLIADQEISVMRAAGMSNWQLSKPALIVAVIATTILYSINLYFTPLAFQSMRVLENNIRNFASASMLQVGEFNTLKGLMVYVRSRTSPKDLRGILIYDNRDAQQPFFVTAEAGSVIEEKQGMRFILVNGVRQSIDKKTNNPTLLYFDQYSLDLTATKVKEQKHSRPQEHYIMDLLNPTGTITSENNFPRYIAHGHMRLVSPMLTLSFSLICLCIILYGEINRRRRTYKIFTIVFAACILQFITFGLINLSERTFIAIPFVYLLFLTLILLLLGQLTGWFSLKRDGFKFKEIN